jgi:hypothetical protein
MRRHIHIGALFVTAIVALGAGSRALDRRAAVEAAAAAAVQAPRFLVDTLLPKPMPIIWILVLTIALSVFAQDLVCNIHRA